MFTVKLSHVTRTRNVFFDMGLGKSPEKFVSDLEKINAESAIILAKAIKDALLKNHPAIRDVINGLTYVPRDNSGQSIGARTTNEEKIRSLDGAAVQGILVQLSSPQEEQGV